MTERHGTGLLAIVSMAAAIIISGDGRNALAGIADLDAVAPIIAVPGDGPALDLDACLRAAHSGNTRLAAERMRRRELDGQMKQALSNGLPTIDLVGDWSRSRDPSFALDSTFGSGGSFGSVPGADPWFDDWLAGFGSLIPPPQEIPAQSFWRANLNLNWTLNPVKVLGAVGAARLGIERQGLAIKATEHALAEQIVVAFHGVISAADHIDAVRAHLANQDEILSIVRLRYEMGMATQLDTLQAAVGRANTVPALSRAEAGLRIAGSRLNALMGRDPGQALRVVPSTEAELGAIDREAALALARLRPDLAQGALMVDILRRSRQAQRADNLPYLSMFGSYGYVGRTTESLFDEGHDSWRASVAVNLPVFDGLLTRGLLQETDGRIRRGEFELSAQRHDVEVEVLDLLARLQTARQTMDLVRVNRERAAEALAQSVLMLKLGKASYLDVLVAEANSADALSATIDARFEVLTLTASLKRALGRSPAEQLRDIPNLVGEVQ